MPPSASVVAPVVSPHVYALIQSSPRLRKMLQPGGLLTSPYEVLDYDAMLTLHDPKGMYATFARRQCVRFLQDGVAGILDHVWGDGVVLTSYHNNAGKLADCFRDGKRHHWVIALKRAMGKGETLAFEVERMAMAQFLKEDGWVETAIDHPVQALRRKVVFPRERPCLGATLSHEGKTVALAVHTETSGRTWVGFHLERPQPDASYLVRWRW